MKIINIPKKIISLIFEGKGGQDLLRKSKTTIENFEIMDWNLKLI